jgi:hypothetical protein
MSATATQGSAPAKTGFALWFQQLKDFKELALIVVFFASGVLWVVNYFATRHELERYKCVNNLTVAMLVSSQNADFLEYQIRTARRDIRASQDLLEKQAPQSDTYKTLANHLDEQQANLDKLQRSQNDAEKKGADAFSKLQDVQQSQSPCK